MTANTRRRPREPGAVLADAATMLERELRHTRRFPLMLIGSIGMPVVMLMLFRYVLGGALGAGIGAKGVDGRYVDYLLPGILVLTAAAGTSTISIGVNTDMTTGIIDRFRTMPIARSSVLAGHVVGGVLRMMVTTAVVAVSARVVGFRPTAGIDGWLGAAGIIVVFAVALSWLSVAMGLAAKTVAGANTGTLVLQFLLPFTSSAFVPVKTMPPAARWFAEHQPFTPVIESVRGLLVGGPVADHAPAALAWSAVLAAVGCWWALANFRRNARA